MVLHTSFVEGRKEHLVDSVYTSAGYCNLHSCSVCNNVTSVCIITTPKNMLPEGLQESTQTLAVTYHGPSLSLQQKMFSRLVNLHTILITGKNIMFIEPETFAMQTNLKKLNISETQLSTLPDILFSPKALNLLLYFPNNNFSKIPVNIFPSIKTLSVLDLSYNPLIGCKGDKSTIGMEFRVLYRLKKLRLAGYGGDANACKDIDVDYFKPIAHVSQLDLSESLLFYGNVTFLARLTNVKMLFLDSLQPFRECPNSATELLSSLPAHVNKISLRNWATLQPANESCNLTDRSLKGLKKLKKLASLTFEGSDNIFGLSIGPQLFKGFKQLKALSLHNCGVGRVQPGAFNYLNQLSNIALVGNQLGSRLLQLYTGNYTSRLKTLALSSVGIDTPEYDLTPLLQRHPTLGILQLNNNQIQTLKVNSSQTQATNIYRLQVEGNSMQNFVPPASTELCKVMPNLTDIYFNNNQLEDITGICNTVRVLRLSGNRLSMNEKRNLLFLATLFKLTNLDISRNELTKVPNYLFKDMSELTFLVLAGNKISEVTSKTFSKLGKLNILDLRFNQLPIFPDSTFSTLQQLNGLLLSDNLITEVPSTMLQVLNGTLKNLTVFSINGNPLICACDNKFKNWVLDSPIVKDVGNITCQTPENRKNITYLIDYDPNIFYCFLRTPIIIIGSVLASVLVSLLVGIPCYKYRWYFTHLRVIVNKLREVKLEHQCVYDAFVSYDTRSVEDTVWVKDVLIPALEEGNGSGDKVS